MAKKFTETRLYGWLVVLSVTLSVLAVVLKVMGI